MLKGATLKAWRTELIRDLFRMSLFVSVITRPGYVLISPTQHYNGKGSLSSPLEFLN